MGHLFIIPGDIRRLKCSAWAISGDRIDQPSSLWGGEVGAKLPGTDLPVDATRTVAQWKWLGEPTEHDPYVVPVGGSKSAPFEWYAQPIRTYLKGALERARPTNPTPLLALPLLGAGAGGQFHQMGAHLRELISLLGTFARESSADIALVVARRAAWEAAQAHRRQLPDDLFAALTPENRAHAERLAHRIGRGEVVVFSGAGVSRAAGAPSWSELLERILLANANLSPAELDAVKKLDPLDQGRLLENRLGDRLKAEVQKALGSTTQHSMLHALLAALPVREFVTTNYDTLLEQAARGIGESVRGLDVAEQWGEPFHVMPYDGPSTVGARWLLKLHGCVKRDKELVLSRRSFALFDSTRGAWSALFSGLLLTRHVVFVGCSMSDDNVLRIFYEADDSLRRTSEAPHAALRLGTNLAVGSTALDRELWARGGKSESELEWVTFDGSVEEQSRKLAIFLDYLAMRTSTGLSFLQERQFDAEMPPADRAAREAIREFQLTVERMPDGPVRRQLDDAVKRILEGG